MPAVVGNNTSVQADLRSLLNLSKDQRLTLTHLSGEINGESFLGHGVGKIDFRHGVSESEILFNSFPKTFTPLACKSWKCKNHLSPDGVSIFAYYQEAIIEYTSGAKGLIHTTGDVRVVNGVSMCFNTFNGTYDGPVNVDEILPWEVEYKRVSGDRYQIKSTRQFKAEGILVEARWSGYLIVRDESKLPDCSIRFNQEKFQWVNPTKDGKALYQESLRLQTTLL